MIRGLVVLRLVGHLPRLRKGFACKAKKHQQKQQVSGTRHENHETILKKRSKLLFSMQTMLQSKICVLYQKLNLLFAYIKICDSKTQTDKLCFSESCAKHNFYKFLILRECGH